MVVEEHSLLDEEVLLDEEALLDEEVLLDEDAEEAVELALSDGSGSFSIGSQPPSSQS